VVAENEQLSTTVNGGLSKDTYSMAGIIAVANHQLVLVAVAQHGSLDDMVILIARCTTMRETA